jgi:hypothetical protein
LSEAANILHLTLDQRLTELGLLEEKRFQAEQLVKAFLWKSGLSKGFPRIICLMGGTGTGKSTLFNSLAGRKISDVGTRRPFTRQAVVHVHADWVEQLKTCPFLKENQADARLVTDSDSHSDAAILIDTPDFDSIQVSNRVIAENYFIISDVMLFVTSQEKYADLAGRKITEMAREWGKNTVFVMNKVASEAAFDDFIRSLSACRFQVEPIRVERLGYSPDLIPGLRERPGFAELLHAESHAGQAKVRPEELDRLRSRAVLSLEELDCALNEQLQRIDSVNSGIRGTLADVSHEMGLQLDAIVTEDLEGQIRGRLQSLLRKYDILFVPRMLVRNAVREVVGAIADLFGGAQHKPGATDRDIRTEDLEQARSAVRLRPLESAVAVLNRRVAELLSSDQSLDDLRAIARKDVPRLGPDEIHSLYEEAFPGIEHLLEEEFIHFKDGLSLKDEFKLYGSYTAWALFIITAEVVMGGGFTLLDALLNTVIMPFIPKWLLNLKVLDVLREIGERVDRKHRQVLNNILSRQAESYMSEFSGLLPDSQQMAQIMDLKKSLVGSARYG